MRDKTKLADSSKIRTLEKINLKKKSTNISPLEKSTKLEESIEEIKKIFTHYLDKNNHRKTPERYSILEEIYKIKGHFNVDTLYFTMRKKNYLISRATIYNTIDLLLLCKLIRKHQFGDQQSYYEKAYFYTQHDHIILVDTGEIIEFCDPRIQLIKATIEELFNIQIESHSLYLYGKKKK